MKFSPLEKNESGFLLLSLCVPQKDEVLVGLLTDEKCRYNLTRRFGQAGDYRVNKFRRPDCWMLEEGSVFEKQPVGQILKIISSSTAPSSIPHDVYRNGKAFCMPMVI